MSFFKQWVVQFIILCSSIKAYIAKDCVDKNIYRAFSTYFSRKKNHLKTKTLLTPTLLPSVLTLRGMFCFLHCACDTVRFWHIASYFVFCKSVVLWGKKKKQRKRQKKQSFNIFTVMQLYVVSLYFHPILYVFIFHVHLVWDHSQSLGKEAAFPIEMIPALWKVPPSPVFHTQKDWLR